MKKTTVKTTSKKTKASAEFKPAFVIDMTECTTIEDLVYAIALAKLYTYLSSAEVSAVVKIIAGIDRDVFMSNVKRFDVSDGQEYIVSSAGVIPVVKKKNIFTRFWNWITRKK